MRWPALPSRRLFARLFARALAGCGLAGLFAPRVLAQHGGAEAAPPPGTVRQPKWGMAIDLDKCTGCGGCVVACRVENNIPVAGAEQCEQGRGIFWMDLLTIEEGAYPHTRRQVLPTPCNHCENAPCVKVCPVGATYQSEEGIVAQIWGRCIGCRYCTTACPYTRRYFNWSAPQWPESLKSQLNPDVATRPVGVVEKCTFCHHRIRAARARARAEDRALTDADVQRLPACAQSCAAGAITFGDLDDPESAVSRLSKSPRAFHLLEDLGTHPKVTYLRETKWQE